MLKEFREFAMRGNVVDMAVGIIIGAAFGKIVTSLVNDVIMPPVGLLIGGVDFSEWFIDLSGSGHATLEAAKEAGAATINLGLFINTLLDFLIVAFAIFFLIRTINRLRARLEKKPEEKPADPTTKECPHCLSSIPVKATKCGHCTSDLATA